jgi:tetratricopeptide (TPR) repeat protein
MGEHASEARDLHSLIELASGFGDSMRLAEIELRQAQLARLMGDYDQALVLVEQALAHAAKSSVLEAQAYDLYGRILIHRGAYAEAAEILDLAMLASEDNNRPDLCAQIEFNLGLTDYHQDQLDAAQAHFDDARKLFDQVSNRRGVIQCLRMTATVHHLAGQLTAALADMHEALALSRLSGWRHSEAFVLGNLGGLQFDMGDYAAAHASYSEARALCHELGDREGEAVALDTLGLIALHRQDAAAAQDLLARAQVIQDQIGDRRGLAYTLTHLGHALTATGDLPAATGAFQQALAIRDRLQPHSGPAVDAIAGLAQVALAAGRYDEANRGVIAALTWMETHDPNQVEYPVQVCLICVEVAEALGRRFVDTLVLTQRALELGYALLMQRAAQIDDEALRQKYLGNVPFNGELVQRYEARTA